MRSLIFTIGISSLQVYLGIFYTTTIFCDNIYVFLGFPDGSAGEESTCNVGDLGWEDPLEKGKATHSSILYSPWAPKELDTTERLSLFRRVSRDNV